MFEHLPYNMAENLPYWKGFDASEISIADLPSEDVDAGSMEAYTQWREKYECQACETDLFDVYLSDFNTSPEEHEEAQKFWVYRLQFMKIIKGKRTCPECIEEAKAKEQFKAASDLVTKTDAMKLYKLSKEDVESLAVQKQIPNQWGMTKLYNREECMELGARKQEEKIRAKEERKIERERLKAARSPSKSPRKKSETSRTAPYTQSPRKRDRPAKRNAKTANADETEKDQDEDHVELA